MYKIFLFSLSLLCLSSSAFAEEDALQAMQAEIDNMNRVPPEVMQKKRYQLNKRIFHQIHNTSEQEKRALVAYTQDLDKRYKTMQKEPLDKPKEINVNDDIEMKYFLKRDFELSTVSDETDL